MPKLTRYLQKIFANNSNEVGVFGTGVDKETSKNVETLQSAEYEGGWSEAIITNKNYPIWQEMDGVQYGLSYQLKYLFQNGIPEWLSTETYYTNSYCRVGSNIYYSLQDDNTNHNPALNDGYWTPLLTSNRSIGEIIPSTIPLTEAGLHLLDGALISSGMYADFVTYMANLTATAPECFCTEAQWQTAVTTYGVCGKFVYDSVNNTVRLPKYSNKIYTGGGTAPVIGNGKTLGLTTGNSTGVQNVGMFVGAESYQGFNVLSPNFYGKTLPYSNNNATAVSNAVKSGLGVTNDPSKSGLLVQLTDITTSLEGYYYIVIATSTKTDIQVDIDEIATDLNGKADVDGTNMSPSVKNFDGQWVDSYLALANSVTYPRDADLEYSLTSYLPSDNYNYEVLFTAQGVTGATAPNFIFVQVKSDIITHGIALCECTTRTNSSVACAGSCIAPIGSERKITVPHGNSTGTFSLAVLGYRRIGTNQ